MLSTNILAVGEKLENDWHQLKLQEFARAAIGRFYYAAFVHLRGLAYSYGFNDSKERSVHTELRDFLENLGYRDIAEDLAALKELRNWADYDVLFSSDINTDLIYAKRTAARLLAHSSL